MASSYANRKSLVEEGRCLTRPEEAPVAMTVFVLVDIFLIWVMDNMQSMFNVPIEGINVLVLSFGYTAAPPPRLTKRYYGG